MNPNKAQDLGSRLGYNNCLCVPAEGSAGGLILWWLDSINLKIIVGNLYLINYIVENDSSNNHD